MKIAIKGHESRGKEVIQILESLGGKNKWFHCGINENCFYELHDDCIWCANTRSKYFKYYTLEEFEKEFPFKIGDVVQTKPYDIPAKIIGLCSNPVSIITYKVRYASGVEGLHSSYGMKLYKEMEEERNIKLTLDKAKEWYKKGGEIKEIALQAFTEKELNPLPRSWEEFCINYSIKNGECWVGTTDCSCNQNTRIFKNWTPSKESAEAHFAMIQLEQLRNCWRQGNIPQEVKYKIRKVRNEYTVVYGIEDSFLSFCDLQTAEEFLKCFRDLIEKAGDLI